MGRPAGAAHAAPARGARTRAGAAASRAPSPSRPPLSLYRPHQYRAGFSSGRAGRRRLPARWGPSAARTGEIRAGSEVRPGPDGRPEGPQPADEAAANRGSPPANGGADTTTSSRATGPRTSDPGPSRSRSCGSGRCR
jgi:hypothetical protein